MNKKNLLLLEDVAADVGRIKCWPHMTAYENVMSRTRVHMCACVNARVCGCAHVRVRACVINEKAPFFRIFAIILIMYYLYTHGFQ